MEKIYKICIVDDHDIVRKGLRNVFSLEYGFDLIGEAASFRDAQILLKTIEPNVLIVDQMLGDGSGFELAREVRALYNNIKIILLTAFPVSEEEKINLEEKIVSTFLYKDQSSMEIRKAVMETLGFQLNDNHDNYSNLLQKLSHREREILSFISKGWQNKEISAEIGISEKTVRNTTSNIFKKLKVNNRTEATLIFLR